MTNIGAYSPDTAKMILDVVNYLRANGFVPLAGQKQPPTLRSPEPIVFKNDSGETIPPYSVMQITGTEEADNQNYITVDKHDDSVFGEYLFNGHDEVEDGEYGTAQHGPIYMAQGDGSTVNSGDLWGIANGTWELTDEGTLFIAVGEDDIETDVLKVMDANVRGRSFGAVTPAAGISAMSGTTPGSATCDLYVIDYAGTWVDTGLNATVYNIFDDVAGSTRITVKPVNDKFLVDAEDCPQAAGSSNPT